KPLPGTGFGSSPTTCATLLWARTSTSSASWNGRRASATPTGRSPASTTSSPAGTPHGPAHDREPGRGAVAADRPRRAGHRPPLLRAELLRLPRHLADLPPCRAQGQPRLAGRLLRHRPAPAARPA